VEIHLIVKMTDDIRKQLDALMGSDRNTSVQKRFTDADVCKYYLCGLCPYEIFNGTVSNYCTVDYNYLFFEKWC